MPTLTWLHAHGLGPSLVITQPDKPKGRNKTLTAPVIKHAAAELGLTVLQPTNLKSESLVDSLKQTDWTVGVVAAYGRIIPEWLLTLPQHGLLNLHPSLLPRYRGASPIQTAIANGDLQTGNTLMQLDAGMDTGPIIGQQPMPISLHDTSLTLEKKLADAVPKLLDQYLLPYLNGSVTVTPQAQDDASATKLLERGDGRINWHDSADRIERLFRAYTPWPGIWTLWQGQVLKLLSVIKKQGNAPEGTVAWDKKTLTIGCGTGMLVVQELQIAGKKASDPESFIRGHADFIGTQLS